jgi:phosphoserine phosphatase
MKLPIDITESVLQIYRRYESSPTDAVKKVAVFDLDNTLIVGDIGEAVYAQLTADGVPMSMTPDIYQVLLEIERSRAYEESVRAMEALSIETIIEATHKVMCSNEESMVLGGECIPVPRPNMMMKDLVRLLRFLDFTIYIISASNDVSVKIIASEWFGVPVANAWGIKSIMQNGKFTSDLQQPVPIGEGKVALYHQNTNGVLPAIVATDSMMDLPLLQMCDPHGMAFLVGASEELICAAKEIMPFSTNLLIVPAVGLSDFNLHNSVAE